MHLPTFMPRLIAYVPPGRLTAGLEAREGAAQRSLPAMWVPHFLPQVSYHMERADLPIGQHAL